MLLRKGRGEVDRAAAQLAMTSEGLRGASDQVVANVTAAHLDRDAAMARADALIGAADRAAEVLALEGRAWELGASDLFVLLQREDRLAKDRKAAIDATLAVVLADVALRGIVGRD